MILYEIVERTKISEIIRKSVSFSKIKRLEKVGFIEMYKNLRKHTKIGGN